MVETGLHELIGHASTWVVTGDGGDERRLVEGIELHIGQRRDRRCPRHLSEERDLAEAVSSAELTDPLAPP